MVPNLDKMVDLLTVKTKQGSIPWNLTSCTDVFRVRLSDYHIEIQESKMLIVNSGGYIIEEIPSTELPKIEILFKEARREVFKISDVVNKIIESLETPRF